MTQDETNAKVLAQLQEYAQLYFEAIIETNMDANGKRATILGDHIAHVNLLTTN